MRDLPVPTETKVVRMAVRRVARRRPSRPKQVRGLPSAIRAKIDASCPSTLAGLRDTALSPETTALLARWLTEAKLRASPLFRGLHLNRPSDRHLTTSSIRRLIKRATARAGLAPETAAELSGHSMRRRSARHDGRRFRRAFHHVTRKLGGDAPPVENVLSPRRRRCRARCRARPAGRRRSQRSAISLMKVILVARKALAAYLINSAVRWCRASAPG
jgi:hypothetical protein